MNREPSTRGPSEPPLLAEMARRVAEVPERTAVTELESGRTLTYGELWAAVERLAGDLTATGLRPAHRVALPLPNSVEWLIGLYACWRAGATPVLMNASFPDGEARSLAESVGVVIALTDRERDLGPVPAVVFGPSGPPALTGIGDAEPVPPPQACVIFTSGTEGRPKAAVLRHPGLYSATSSIATALRGRPGPYPAAPGGPPSFVCLPLSHSGGLTSVLFAVHVGRSILLARRFRPEVVTEAVREYGIDTLVATPTMLTMLLHDAAADLTGVKMVQSTGAGLAPPLQRRFEERFRVPVIQNYGQTETAHVAGWTKDDLRAGNWRPGSVGRPYPGVTVEIRNDDGKALPANEVGEITVHSGHVMKGYEGTTAAGDWVATGDLGYLDDDGYLFVVDRKREMIICGGFNIYPAELEALIHEHPGVAEVAVIGVPDERLGEIPKALVVPAPDAHLTAQDIVDFTRERTAHFRAVRAAEIVAELPTTATAKVHRARLRSSRPTQEPTQDKQEESA